MRFPVFFLLLIAVCLAGGCVTVPVSTIRGAELLGPKEESQVVDIVTTTPFLAGSGVPTALGPSALEYAFRKGVTDGVERAYRVGMGSAFVGPWGLYLGVEQAYDLRRDTRDWGTVGYGGILGGFDGFFGAFIPLHTYGQLYGGIVSGRVTGTYRPSINLRLGVQPGFTALDPYGVAVLTVEPRMRFQGNAAGFFLALGFDAGYAYCECTFLAEEEGGGFIYGVHPQLGVEFR